MANGWTVERRQRQAERIHQWKPWEQNSGPKTPEGKSKASLNAYKNGIRPKLRELSKALRAQHEALVDIVD